MSITVLESFSNKVSGLANREAPDANCHVEAEVTSSSPEQIPAGADQLVSGGESSTLPGRVAWRSAETCPQEAESRERFDPRTLWCLELAKLHTVLVQVAAIALDSDCKEWAEVAGRRFSSMSRILLG